MAHLRCDFRSEVLDMNTSMTVVLPDFGTGVSPSAARVIYVLHGLADNCTGWSRYTSIERYARGYNAALVIPEVQRSFYSDMDLGSPYFSFIHDELPKICRNFFGFSEKREQNYLMGLSMGGYGALKCALTTPERYAGVATFSAVADMARFVTALSENKKQFQAIFGPELRLREEDDLLKLAAKAEGKGLPRFYMACGAQDELSLCPDNLRLSDLLKDRGADVTFESWDGQHNWDFWDPAAKKGMAHIFKD